MKTKRGYWFKYCTKKELPGQEKGTGDITGMVWCTPQQKRWLKRWGRRCAIDCTYNTNKTKLRFFQATAKTGTGKIVNLFQGVIDNECEEAFRWILHRWKDLLTEEGLQDPLVIVTDFDVALINAIDFTFNALNDDGTGITRHQLCSLLLSRWRLLPLGPTICTTQCGHGYLH